MKSLKNYLYMLTLILGIATILRTSVQTKAMTLSADSAIVMDVQSGTILYEKNMDKKEYPASITKVMTAMLAIENSSLEEVVTYSSQSLQLESGASNIGIVEGEKLTMEESLYAILLMSANEACNGVAEHIAGSTDKFVEMMNARAKELGCTGTHFANTNGLWLKNHYTTAHDMGLIARAAYNNPTFAKITGTKRYVIGKTNKCKTGHYLHNHHGMLLAGSYPQYVYEYCVGGKTGYTSKCRYTLVTYAKKNGMTLVSVVMRSDAPWMKNNEYSDTTKLLNSCFEKYSRYNIQDDATETVNSQYLFTRFSPFFSKETSSISVDEDAGVLLPKGVTLADTEKKVSFLETADGALVNGKKVIGHISYTYKGQEVGGSDIYYKQSKILQLNDSIDMSGWFTDAVENANKEPFPWKKFFLILILSLVVLVVGFYIVQRLMAEREQRARRKRYKKSKKNTRRMGHHDRW
ncbi:MAG: D-alanyl-D-alanine carboxypeptidase [Eubacterium sp.]|nr:D-alanyl-D-alanine carboxypeptidase [Eubacterium sp.]